MRTLYDPTVANLDNPAGRLHAILREYRESAQDQVTIRQTWAGVLGVEQDRVPVALTEVAGIIPAIEAAVSRSGEESQQEVFDHYVYQWAYAITTPDHPTGQTPSPGKELVDPGALAALGGLSSFLCFTASEGHLPNPEQLQSLRERLLETIDEATVAEDIPPELRRELLDRLHEILWAIDHLRVGGPSAASAAAERLVGAVAIREDGHRLPIVRRALQAAAAAWTLFKTGSTLTKELESWREILRELPPG